MDELICAAFGGKMFGVDRDTGQIRWNVDFSEWNSAIVELVLTPERAFAFSPHYFVIVNRRTGEVIRKIHRKDEAVGQRPVVLHDRDRFFIGGMGAVACYSSDGEFLWQQPFKGKGYGEMALGVPGNVRQADDRGSR
jgi:outer membrane protein assembly factor BamB